MKILVVEGNPIDRAYLRRLLSQFPGRHAIDEAATGALALDQLARERYRCMLLGNGLMDMTASQLLGCLGERAADAPPVVLLCDGDEERALRQCLQSGAQHYLLKSEVSVAALTDALRRAIEWQRSQLGALDRSTQDPLTSLHTSVGAYGTAQVDATRWGDREHQQRVRHRLAETVRLRPFHLHYQPRYRAQTQGLEALEGLMRWDDAELGPVPPSAFIPICERNGMISLVGRVAVERASEDWRRHLDRVAADPPLKVSLNLSPAQLLDDEFLTCLKNEAEDRSSLRGRLQVEISDKAGVQNSRRCMRALEELVSAGVGVAIDDFGTGSTSVAQLTSMPISGVILDAALTDGIAPETSQARRVGALIAMANALGITVTAKRIETAAQLQFLIALGCHHAQGNALSSPLAPDEVAHVLRGAATT